MYSAWLVEALSLNERIKFVKVIKETNTDRLNIMVQHQILPIFEGGKKGKWSRG